MNLNPGHGNNSEVDVSFGVKCRNKGWGVLTGVLGYSDAAHSKAQVHKLNSMQLVLVRQGLKSNGRPFAGKA